MHMPESTFIDGPFDVSLMVNIPSNASCPDSRAGIVALPDENTDVRKPDTDPDTPEAMLDETEARRHLTLTALSDQAALRAALFDSKQGQTSPNSFRDASGGSHNMLEGGSRE